MQSPARPRRGFFVLLACASIAQAPLLVCQPRTAPGFSAKTHVLPKPPKGWIGFGTLGTDLVAFDGRRLVRIDPRTGLIRATLTTLPAAVFGSEVLTGPSGKRVFFGESSTGALWLWDAITKRPRQFATLGGNFDFAFHPLEGERFLYVAAQPGFTGNAKVFRIDVVTGARDLIGEAAGFAGPIEFDPRGNLLFAPGGKGTILRWSRGQVLSAIGPRSLTEREASVFVSGLPSAFDFVIDGEGTLYVADAASNSTSSLLEVGPGGRTYARGVLRAPGQTLTSLLLADGNGPFERFGSSTRTLFVIATDFAAKHELVALRPARPELRASSTNPRGGSHLAFTATANPARGVALWLLGAGRVPERPWLPLGAAGLAFPDFGVVLTVPVLAVVTPIDGAGATKLTMTVPKQNGLQWTTQVLAGPVAALPGGTPASPWVTTNPVRVVTK